MTEFEEISKQLNALSEQNKALSKKVDEFTEGDDLEIKLDKDEAAGKNHSQMLEINPGIVDSFGDPIELATKSRLKGYEEAFEFALNFVEREYHNMSGNRFGKHSKYIRVFDENGKANKIDMVWFSGNSVRVVDIKDRDGITRKYYKIRILVRDILNKKILLLRVPTSDGKARDEEIKHMGAGRMSEQNIQDLLNITPMRPIKYTSGAGRQIQPKKVGEALFE